MQLWEVRALGFKKKKLTETRKNSYGELVLQRKIRAQEVNEELEFLRSNFGHEKLWNFYGITYNLVKILFLKVMDLMKNLLKVLFLSSYHD